MQETKLANPTSYELCLTMKSDEVSSDTILACVDA